MIDRLSAGATAALANAQQAAKALGRADLDALEAAIDVGGGDA